MSDLKCTWNGCELDEEEQENPKLDPSGNVICDECYHEHFEFACSLCQDYEDDPYEAIRNAALMVLDEDECKIPRGFYQIIKWPFYTTDMLSMWLHEGNMRLVSDVPEAIGECAWDGYPSGQLCLACQIKYGIPPGYGLFDPIYLGC